MERISLFLIEVAGVSGQYHQGLIYTDSLGNRFVIDGQRDRTTGLLYVRNVPFNISGYADAGRIVYEQTLLEEPSLGAEYFALTSVAADITAKQLTYELLTQNSNSAASTLYGAIGYSPFLITGFPTPAVGKNYLLDNSVAGDSLTPVQRQLNDMPAMASFIDDAMVNIIGEASPATAVAVENLFEYVGEYFGFINNAGHSIYDNLLVPLAWGVRSAVDASLLEFDDVASSFANLLAELGLNSNDVAQCLIEDGSIARGSQISLIKAHLAYATSIESPLVLDLDGDGIEVSAVDSSTAFFDLDSSGTSERTGWVGADDALLARDINNNGRIDNGGELFGNHTAIAGSGTAADGFAALADLDSNHDGVVDGSDTAFAELRLWQDADQDGISDAGELMALAEAGIASISLASTASTDTINGNPVSATGFFTRTDATTGTMADVWFARDEVLTRYRGDFDLSLEALALPRLRGYGNLKDLTIAMSMDATLLGMVQGLSQQDLVNLLTNGTLDAEIDDMLFRWAGVDNVVAGSRGENVDARHIAFIEQYMGQPFLQQGWNPNPFWQAAERIEFAWQEARMAIKGDLLAQLALSDLFPNLNYDLAADALSGTTDINTDALSAIAAGAVLAPDIEAYWTRAIDAINAVTRQIAMGWAAETALNDAIYNSDNSLSLAAIQDNLVPPAGFGITVPGTEGDDIINGTVFNDTLSGGGGDDTIYGSNGNDIIYGGDGNDILDGGSGGNTLFGWYGDDTYIIGRGEYTITDPGGVDKLKFAAGITAGDLSFSRTLDNQLKIDIAGGGTVIVEFYFPYNEDTLIENFEFADASTVDPTLLSYTVNGGDNIDTIYGITNSAASHNDVLNGAGGNDLLYGRDGNDTLDGGNGNDLLMGETGDDIYIVSSGNDTYSEAWGGGFDTIKFSAGITIADLSFSRDQFDNLHIAFGTNTLTITAQFNGLEIEQLKFADNSTFDLLLASYVTNGDDGYNGLYGISSGGSVNDIMNGFGGNDQLGGGEGNDVLDGGDGNDSINGGMGDDIYIASAGNDLYSEVWGGGVDTIRFGASITLNDIVLNRTQYNELLITHGTNTIIVNSQFGGEQIEQLKFADNSTFDLTAAAYVTNGDEYNNYLYGVSEGASLNDTLNGFGGDDQLGGGEGNDILDGGNGNDSINGGMGDDIYIASAGNDLYSEAWGGGFDTIKFGIGITFKDIALSRTIDNQLLIVHQDGAILVNSQFGGEQIEQVQFADNSTFDLTTAAFVTHGDENNNYIYGVYSGASLNDTLMGYGGDDTLLGGEGDDILDSGDGNDLLDGGAGNDQLISSVGATVMIGGLGADTFIYLDRLHAATAVDKRDTILDFSYLEGDLIDLSAIDANANLSGNQAFYLGGSSFSNIAGELIQYQSGDDWVVEGDIDGDGAADLFIALRPLSQPLVSSDFVL